MSADDLARDLDRELAFEPTEADLATPAPNLVDEAEAERYAYALRRLEDEMTTIDELCAERVEQIQTWRDRRQMPLRERAAWLTHALEAFVRRNIRAGARRKSIDLPSYRVQLIAPTGRVEVRDPVQFLQWSINLKKDDPPTNEVPFHTFVAPPPPPPLKPDTKAIADRLRKSTAARSVGDVVEHEFVDENGEPVPGIVWVIAPRDRFQITTPKTQEDK